MSIDRQRILRRAALSLALNLAFALYYGILGAVFHSWWFITMFAYYALLGATRFAAVLTNRKGTEDTEFFVLRFCGALLMLLSLVLSGIICISQADSIAARYHEVVMISIALFTFVKLGMAIVRAVRQRREPSPLLAAIRCITYAEAAAAILTMQRSMLVSFGNMAQSSIILMNALTGAAVCVFVFGLGISMHRKGRIKSMSEKSKFVKANEKIAETVTSAYGKVENAVVGGYNKVESAFVNGYTKVEDHFVDKYLRREGETIAEAKARLKEKAGE